MSYEETFVLAPCSGCCGALRRRLRRQRSGPPNSPPQPDEDVLTDFEIEFRDLEPGGATVVIAPKDKTKTYWFNLLTREDFEAFPDEESLVLTDYTYLEQVAANNGVTLEQLLEGELFRGDKTWEYKALAPETSYTFYIYGLDTSGNATTAVNHVGFTTPEVQPVDCTFEITASEVTTSSFKLTVAPSDAKCAYYYDVFTQEVWYDMCGGDPDKVPAFMDEYIQEVAVQMGLTVPEVVARMSSYGERSELFQYLDAGTTYYAFAIGLGPDGTTTTPAAVREVQTEAQPVNTFAVEEVEIGFDKASFRVLPSQDEAYVALYELQEYFEGMSDQEMIEEVIRAYGADLGNRIHAGSNVVSEEMLVPDKPYYLLVFGYAYGEVSTPLFKHPFTTQKAQKVDCTFEITIRNVMKNTADATITPSDDKASYFFHVIPAAEYAENGGDEQAIRDYANRIIDDLLSTVTMPRYEMLTRTLARGTMKWSLEELEAGTAYYVFAVGMTADGSFTTAVVMSDPFVTQAEGTSVATLEFLPNIMSAGSLHPDEALVYGWFYPKHAAYTLVSNFVDDDSVYRMEDAQALGYLAANSEQYHDSAISVWNYVPFGHTVYYVAAAYDADNLPVLVRETVTPQDPSVSSVCRPLKHYCTFDLAAPGLSGRPERCTELKIEGLRGLFAPVAPRVRSLDTIR